MTKISENSSFHDNGKIKPVHRVFSREVFHQPTNGSNPEVHMKYCFQNKNF